MEKGQGPSRVTSEPGHSKPLSQDLCGWSWEDPSSGLFWLQNGTQGSGWVSPKRQALPDLCSQLLGWISYPSPPTPPGPDPLLV